MTDKLDVIRKHAAAARDIELEIADLENQVRDLKAKLWNLYHGTIPSLLNDAGLDRVGVPPDGNKPGVDYILRPYYAASISSKWDEPKRQMAFDVLRQYKANDLIKTKVEARFPKGNLQAAKKLAAHIKKMKIEDAAIVLEQSVHASTLTAWLKDIYERGQALPASDLEKIGASVGQYVRASDRKE